MSKWVVLVPAALLLCWSIVGCDGLVSIDQRLERASEALESGDLGRASIELHKAANRSPEDERIQFLVAKLQYLSGDVMRAHELLEKLGSEGMNEADFDELRKNVLLASNQGRELLELLENGGIRLRPDEVSLVRARALIAMDEPRTALEAVGPVLSGDDVSEARVVAAKALVRLGQSDDALRELMQIAPDHASAWEAQLLTGQIFLERGDARLAEETLRSALRSLPAVTPALDRGSVLDALLSACMAQGKMDEAGSVYAQLEDLLPRSMRTRVLGSRLMLARGDYDGAILVLQRVLAKAPEYPEARFLLGFAQLVQGSPAQAEANLMDVVRQRPGSIEARKLLARARLQMGRPDSAAESLGPAAALPDADADVFQLLGDAWMQSGETAKAIAALEAGVHAEPGDIERRLDLAQGYLVAGRAQEAVQLLNAVGRVTESARYRTLLTASILAADGPRAARDEVERQVSASPNSVAVLDAAAAFYVTQGEFDRARALLVRAAEIEPQSPQIQLLQARLESAAGNLDLSEQLLRIALKQQSGTDAARRALSRLLVRRGRDAEALELLKSATTHAPVDLLEMADVQLRMGMLSAANSTLDQLVAISSDKAAAQNQAGRVLLRGLQYEGSVARFREATRLAPTREYFWLDLARGQLAMSQIEAARESARKALDRRPDWVPAIAVLVLADLGTQRSDSALSRAASLALRRADDPAAQVLYGDVLSESGRHRDAAQAYDVAIRLKQDGSVAIKLFRARMLAGLPKPEEPLTSWLAMQPGDVPVRVALAQYELRRGNLAAAAGQYEQLLKDRPDDAVYLNNLAWIYHRGGDPRALVLAEKAGAIAPDSAQVADTLGWILLQNGEHERALAQLKRAAGQLAEDPSVAYHYGAALAAAGRHHEAMKVLQAAVSSSSAFPERLDAERLLGSLGPPS